MESETLIESAIRVLNTSDPYEKARPAIRSPSNGSKVKSVSPSLMPKLGKAGSLKSRQAIVHSLAHIESWAVGLSWDIIAHFSLLAARLKEMGGLYGALPAHDGLWDSATATSQDLLARLAVEHCVHEARGLVVLPTTISRFRNGGDEETADLLETVIYPEEITYCAAGVKWFKYLCERSKNPEFTINSEESDESNEEIIKKFHSVVREHFRGPLKPPFNVEAREAAGFGPQWYEPLAVKESNA